MSAVTIEFTPEARQVITGLGGRVAAPGDQEQRRALGDLLGRARRGEGGVLLVEGEPGVGRSLRLLEAADEAAGSGFSLVAGAADQLGQAIPFFALRQAFAGRAAGWTGDDQPALPAWWISQVRAHLEERAAAVPVLVCLDDLQWAGAETLAALRTLPRELARHPVAWVLARSTIRQPEAERLFDSLAGDGAARLRLAPLTEAGTAVLLTTAFGAPPHPGLRALANGAAGNPRLLAALVGGLREEDAVRVTDGRATLVSARLPSRVHRAARRRLDGVGARARHVLTTAAVLDGSFRLDHIAEMLGETPAALLPAVEETMAAGLTSAGENEFSFRHQLLRRAIGDLVPRPGRTALHRQYGQILLRRGESAALAAGHLLQAAEAGNPASLSDLDAAAGQALRTAPPAAADLAYRALELTPPGDRDALPRAVAAARALSAVGRLDEADRVARDALARPLPRVAEARLRCVLSAVLCARGAAREAAAEAETVLTQPGLPDDARDDALTARLQALAGARDPTAGPLADAVLKRPARHAGHVMVAALIARAAASWDAGRAGEALELLRDAARQETTCRETPRRDAAGRDGAGRDGADRDGADRDKAHQDGADRDALRRNAASRDEADRDKAHQDAADRETGSGHDARYAQPLLALSAVLVDLRRLDEAEAILEAANDRAPHGAPARSAASIVRARISLARGRLADAEAAARDALAAAESAGAYGYASAARCVLAVITLRGGDPVTAARHLADGVVPGPQPGDWYARAEVATAQAQVSEACDGAAGVLTRLRRACAELEEHPGLLLGDPAAAAWLARTALAAGDAGLAAAVARAAGALAAASPGYPAVTAAAAHSRGLADWDQERLAEAAAQHPDWWARARASEDLGLLHAGRDEHDPAVRHLTEAVRGYLDVGAAGDAARTRHALRRLGVRHRDWSRPATRPVTGWESLTNAERTTAELVAQGLNNRQVAGRMYVSEHTVAFYLRQAFRKLDIRSRVQLTRIVIERRPTTDDAAAGPRPSAD